MSIPRGNHWLGIHLSGPSADRTVVAVSEFRNQKLVLTHLIDRIGSRGMQSSDDRVIEIIGNFNIGKSIFVDTPLGLPPCLSCARPVCPSAVKCDDLAVAYMLSLSLEKRKKGKLFSPQSHRVWDLLFKSEFPNLEPTFSANQAPLVLRAQILQKRLRAFDQQRDFMETNVIHSLLRLSHQIGIPVEKLMQFKGFEHGYGIRQRIIDSMIDKGMLDMGTEIREKLMSSIDCFSAGFCSWMNSQFSLGRLETPPADYIAGESWVWLPRATKKIGKFERPLG